MSRGMWHDVARFAFELPSLCFPNVRIYLLSRHFLRYLLTEIKALGPLEEWSNFFVECPGLFAI